MRAGRRTALAAARPATPGGGQENIQQNDAISCKATFKAARFFTRPVPVEGGAEGGLRILEPEERTDRRKTEDSRPEANR